MNDPLIINGHPFHSRLFVGTGKFASSKIMEDTIIASVAMNTHNNKKQSAKALMQNNTPKISPGIDIIEATKIMANHNVQNIPVVQNGQLLGVLTLKDLFNESPALTVMVIAKGTTNNHHHKGAQN